MTMLVSSKVDLYVFWTAFYRNMSEFLSSWLTHHNVHRQDHEDLGHSGQQTFVGTGEEPQTGKPFASCVLILKLPKLSGSTCL